MIFVYARVVDKNGTTVPNSTAAIEFSLEGNPKNVKIIGGNIINAEAGIATILLRTESFTGSLNLRASSHSLGESVLTIKNP